MTTTMMINQHGKSNEIKKEESTLALASAVVAPLYSFYDSVGYPTQRSKFILCYDPNDNDDGETDYQQYTGGNTVIDFRRLRLY